MFTQEDTLMALRGIGHSDEGFSEMEGKSFFSNLIRLKRKKSTPTCIYECYVAQQILYHTNSSPASMRNMK